MEREVRDGIPYNEVFQREMTFHEKMIFLKLTKRKIRKQNSFRLCILIS